MADRSKSPTIDSSTASPRTDISKHHQREPRLGLRTKLIRVYALQVLLISLAALIGLYITYVIVEDVLSRQALNDESAHFWELLANNPDQPLPNTANLIGYLRQPGSEPDIPTELLGLEPGFGRVHALPNSPLVHVSQRDGATLYLVLAQAQVSELVFYFGLAPLAAVLLTVYVLLFLTYRLSHQAISPLLNLARALERFDFRSTERLEIPLQPDDVDNETRLMVEALEEFSERLDSFIERERTFTRNASHELRTPIAVIKGSLELLASRPTLSEDDAPVIERMRRVAHDMETILETLLMLAREEDVFSDAPTNLNQVVAEEIELLAQLAEENGNTVDFIEEIDATCRAKPNVLAIIVSNLLRNALTYTHNGKVTVRVTDRYLAVSDTGIGMSETDSDNAFTAFYRGEGAKAATRGGQGLGLALVRRLSQQLGWRVDLDSELNKGTEFRMLYR